MAPSTDVATTEMSLDTVALRGIETVRDMEAVFAAMGVDMVDASELGDGFDPYPKDKSPLVGAPMMLISAQRGYSKDYTIDGQPASFTVLRFITQEKDGSIRKYFLTDGSTGIHKQIDEFLRARGNETGSGMIAMRCPGGLSVSKYETDGFDKNGQPVKIPATTYYISTASQ